MSDATHLSRADYLAIGAMVDGESWDWLHNYEIPVLSEADAIEWRDAACDAAMERYLAAPQWTDKDTHDERVAIASGRDPRRTLALHKIVMAERDAAEAKATAKRLRRAPCRECGA